MTYTYSFQKMVLLKSFQICRIPLTLARTIKPFCCLLLISGYVNQGKTNNIQSPSTKRFVVVFDVDNTLCNPAINDQESKFARRNHPECPVIHWKHDGTDYPHIFVPYLQILFDYLLVKEVRIVFFSSAIEERNIIVIPALLTSFWGNRRYEELKSKGQFTIFSKEHLRRGNGTGEGDSVKDLEVVIKDGESLSNSILIEAEPSYTAHDQRPFIRGIDVAYLPLHKRSSSIEDEFAKNSVYYMLGLFKTYFEHDEYKKLSLREGLKQILPPEEERREDTLDYFKKHPLVRKTIETGLSEVQKKVRNATLYGSFIESEG